MDGLTFTQFIPLTQKEGAGLGNGSAEEDNEFSFGHFGFDLEYPVERSDKQLSVRPGMLRREIWESLTCR